MENSKMGYIKVKWVHSFSDEPVLLYSELDSERWETRKVEVFADGRMNYADRTTSSGDTKLSIEPLPTLDQIDADPQFEPEEITKTEFETVWKKAAG